MDFRKEKILLPFVMLTPDQDTDTSLVSLTNPSGVYKLQGYIHTFEIHIYI